MPTSEGRIDSAVITREELIKLLSDTHMEGYYQGIDHGITIIEKTLKLDLSEVRKIAVEIAADERKNNGNHEEDHHDRRDAGAADRSEPGSGRSTDTADVT